MLSLPLFSAGRRANHGLAKAPAWAGIGVPNLRITTDRVAAATV